MPDEPIPCDRCGQDGHLREACPNVPNCPACGNATTVRCACAAGLYSCPLCRQHWGAP